MKESEQSIQYAIDYLTTVVDNGWYKDSVDKITIMTTIDVLTKTFKK